MVSGSATAAHYRMLYDYNCWARDRLFDAMAGLSDEDFARPNGFTYGSIRGILVHVLRAEQIWLDRWRQETRTRVTTEDVPSVDALQERCRAEEQQMRGFLASLTDADVDREIVSLGRDGREFRRPLWHDLAHVAIHTIQHRSEAAEALTMIGRSPGDLDLKVFLARQAVQP